MMQSILIQFQIQFSVKNEFGLSTVIAFIKGTTSVHVQKTMKNKCTDIAVVICQTVIGTK